MGDVKQAQLREKIAAGQERVAARGHSLIDKAGEKAIEAKDQVTTFAREHPIATVAGGLAIGVLISGLLYRRRARGSSASATASDLGHRAAGLATLGADYALTYILKAIDSAGDAGRAGADRLGDFGEAIDDNTRGLRRSAGHLAEDVGERVLTASHDAGRRVRSAGHNVGDVLRKSLRRH